MYVYMCVNIIHIHTEDKHFFSVLLHFFVAERWRKNSVVEQLWCIYSKYLTTLFSGPKSISHV